MSSPKLKKKNRGKQNKQSSCPVEFPSIKRTQL